MIIKIPSEGQCVSVCLWSHRQSLSRSAKLYDPGSGSVVGLQLGERGRWVVIGAEWLDLVR